MYNWIANPPGLWLLEIGTQELEGSMAILIARKSKIQSAQDCKGLERLTICSNCEKEIHSWFNSRISCEDLWQIWAKSISNRVSENVTANPQRPLQKEKSPRSRRVWGLCK